MHDNLVSLNFTYVFKIHDLHKLSQDTLLLILNKHYFHLKRSDEP